jgi:hypothetical protein
MKDIVESARPSKSGTGLPDKLLGWPERSVAFRRWGSVTNSMSVTLLRGGMHLILANPPSDSYKSAPRKFRETRSTMEGMLSQNHCVAQFNTAHNLSGGGPLVLVNRKLDKSGIAVWASQARQCPDLYRFSTAFYCILSR